MHALIRIALSVAIAMPAGSRGQAKAPEPPSVRIATVPLHALTGGVVFVRACVNDYADTLNFLLDTGSGGISLDSSTCVEFGMPVVPTDKTIRGIAGVRKVDFLYGARLKMPGITVDSLDFHMNDYEILTSVYGIKVDGIIGYSFFNRYIVRLDYDNMLMEVHTPGEYRYPRGGHLLRPLMTSLPILTARFRDGREMDARFYYDTGAGLAFLLSESFARDSAVLARKRKEPLVTQAEGVGGKMTMKLTTVKEVRVGPYRFRRVPTFLFDDKYNVTSYPFLGGLVGNEILHRFNTVLNYRKREIHIIPNRFHREPFDYAYTGLGIYYVNRKVMVEDVIPGSPGEQAGFLPGDIVIGINNDFSNNITAYKNMMQHAGGRLRFVVSRNGKLIILRMRPSRIY